VIRRHALAAVAVAVLSATSAARAEPLEPRPAALLVLRVLAFDRALARRASGAALVAVASRAGDAAGEARRDALVEALREVGRDFRARGLAVEARAVTWGEAPERSLSRAVAVVVVGRLGEEAEAIARTTRAKQVLSVGEDRGAVDRGLAVALFARGTRAVIAASLVAAREEGVAFEPSFLRQAELIEFPGSTP
jgi:hypothetical protein